MKKGKIISTILVLMLVMTVFTACSQGGTSGGSNYPAKPVTIIVPYGAGGGTDTGTRLLAKYAEEHFGQTFVIQNVEGAGGEVGFSQMVRSNPDGYTLSAMTLGHVTLTTTREASYNPVTDIQPVALIVKDPSFLVVRADDDRFKTIEDVIEFAKANPNKFTVGTSGAGSSDHIGVLAINNSQGVELKPVHFGGAAEAKSALLGGHVDAYMPTFSEAKQIFNDGTAIALACSDKIEGYEDVPSFEEKGINAPITATRGFAAPKDIPSEVLAKLEDAFKKAAEDPKFIEEMNNMGLGIRYLSSNEYKELIAEQYEFFTKMAEELQLEN